MAAEYLRFSELRCLLIKFWVCAFNCEVLFIGFKSLVTTESMSDFTQSFIIQKMLKGMDRLHGVEDSPKPITLELLVSLLTLCSLYVLQITNVHYSG